LQEGCRIVDRNIDKERLLDALGRLSDHVSLQVMVKALDSGRLYESAAARSLGLRRDPEAEFPLIAKFSRADTKSDTFDAIEARLATSAVQRGLRL
jgi:hypothetical protein